MTMAKAAGGGIARDEVCGRPPEAVRLPDAHQFDAAVGHLRQKEEVAVLDLLEIERGERLASNLLAADDKADDDAPTNRRPAQPRLAHGVAPLFIARARHDAEQQPPWAVNCIHAGGRGVIGAGDGRRIGWRRRCHAGYKMARAMRCNDGRL